MSEPSRRELLAVGEVAVGASVATTAPAHATAGSREAGVSQVRWFAAQVCLEISPDLKGWADFGDVRKPTNVRAFAIAAAAAAVGKKVHMTWTDHDRNEYESGGEFENVKLAFPLLEG